MNAYASFEDIPPEHRGFLEVAYWMTKNDRSIEQIPEDARTDRLMFFHLYLKPHRFQSITPASKRYYAHCEFALWRTCEVLPGIPVVFITESLVKRLTLGGSRHCLLDTFKNKPQFDHLYTDELIDLTLQRSLAFLYVLHKRGVVDLVKWASVVARLKQAPYESQFVIQFGLRDRLRDEMRAGLWFDDIYSPLGFMKFDENPRNPLSVIQQWCEASTSWSPDWFRDNEQIFAVKMDCFEDTDVIPELVSTSPGRRFLQIFYRMDRVKALFESSREVRGYILEQELAV